MKSLVSRWIISDKGDNGAYIKSKKKGLVFPPVKGWEYDGGASSCGWLGALFDCLLDVCTCWPDDDTLTVTGKYVSCLTLI